MNKLFILFFIGANSTLSWAQDVDLGKALIEAINLPIEEKRKEIIQEIFSINALNNLGINRIMNPINRWNDEYTPLEYHHTEINEFKKQTGSVYVMHVYARKNGEIMFKDFQFYLDSNPPHKIENIAFIAEVAEPVNLPNGSIEQSQTLEWLSAYAANLNEVYDLYGSYQILKGSSIIFNRQYGFEDLERTIPISENTLFNIASGGKMFTAVGIAQLVEGRKISYDDPITKYLKGFNNKTYSDKIKIHHLLSHTSGVAEYWTRKTDPEVYSATTIDDHLKIVYEAGFDFEAGSKYQYCNSNFILLGAIIEKVSRINYYDYVKQNIFERAGMTSTAYYEHGTRNVATQLARNEGIPGWKEGRHGMKGSSAGGAYSTLADINRFSIALRSNVLIRRETLEYMTSIKNPDLDVSEEYGYGFMLSKKGGEFGFGHGGTADGVNFEFDYYPRQDITLILFCNQNNGAYDDLKKNMIKLITGYR